MRTHGEYESVLIALFSTGPISAKEFKRRFPKEFEKIKGYTNGADFTQKMIDNISEDLSGVDWKISNDKYMGIGYNQERMSELLDKLPDEERNRINDIIQSGAIDRYDEIFEEEDDRKKIRKLIDKEKSKEVVEDMILLSVNKDEVSGDYSQFLSRMEMTSVASGHPVSKIKREYTIGWIRFSRNEETILITEVQSDLIAAKAMAESPAYRLQAKRMGMGESYMDEMIEKIEGLSEFTDRVYEDAIAMIFLIAAKEGLSVEMLTSKSKEDSPINVYEDLPRKMGMTKGASDIDGKQVWKYKPSKLG